MSEQQFKVKNPKPLFRRGLRRAPGHPLGERVLVREFPPESESEGGIAIAEKAKTRYMAGQLVAVGDQAADRLYDVGVEIGDEIWYAQYAGVVQEWQHIVGKDNADCPHDGVWDLIPVTDAKKWATVGGKNDNINLRECRSCGTLKAAERLIVMAYDDVHLDVDLEERLESGTFRRRRDVTDEGRTRYTLVRPDGWADQFETKEWEKV